MFVKYQFQFFFSLFIFNFNIFFSLFIYKMKNVLDRALSASVGIHTMLKLAILGHPFLCDGHWDRRWDGHFLIAVMGEYIEAIFSCSFSRRFF